MTHPTLISPNTGNLRVGKGALWFTKEGGVRTHLGNCPSIEFTPTITKLDHFSAMAGIKLKDASVILESGGALKVVMEEWTAYNLSLMLLGDVNEAAVGGPTVDILTQSTVNGMIEFISANEVGPKVNLTLYNVSFAPSGSINPISDEWGNMEVTGEVLASQTAPNVGKFGFMQITNIDS